MVSVNVLRQKMTHLTYKAGYRFLPGLLAPRDRRPLVLLYHDVAEQPCALSNKLGINITPARFEQHIRYLTENYRVVPFSQLRAGQCEPGTVAITFDDGFDGIRKHVLPVIEKYRCPIKVFLTVSHLTGINWTNRLCYLLNVLTRKEVADLAHEILEPAPAPGATITARTFAEAFVEGRTAEAVNELFARRHPGPARQLYLTESAIRTLAAHPLVELGSHTRHHYPLARISAKTLHDEVVGAHQELNRLFDRKIKDFAIPFGYRCQRTDEVVKVIGQIDAPLVLSAYGGSLDWQDCHGLPEVKRISVCGSLGTLWYCLRHLS